MDVRVETHGEISVLKPAGRLDGPGAKKFRHAASSLGASGKAPLAVDLSETTALLASGVEALHWLAVQRRDAGAKLAIVGCSASSRKLLDASGLTAIVPVGASLADARAVLQANRRP